jgi:hypothetical protein
MWRRSRLAFLLFVAVTLFFPWQEILAQTTGSLRGSVTDPSDLVVVGAKVTARLETGIRSGASDFVHLAV